MPVGPDGRARTGAILAPMPLLTMKGAFDRPVAWRFEDDAIAIGRSPDNDVVLPDERASRVHAVIVRRGDGWDIQDRRSRQGTRLNGRLVEGPTRLRTGDVIGIGSVELVFDAGPAEETPALTTVIGSPVVEPDIVAESPALRAVLALVDRVAPTKTTILIVGEMGTGKDLIARRLHARSDRARGPFVVVNCPALPAGLVESELFGVERGVATGVDARVGRLEMAHSGTLFLDEVGDLELTAQGKLLRFLQDHVVERVGGRKPIEVDARIVAATNRDLDAAVSRGAFRSDLLHRLGEIIVSLPPLRERREDIAPLVERALARSDAPRRRLGDDARALLDAHSWPGNVRELEHVLRRAAFIGTSEVISATEMTSALRTSPGAETGTPDGRLLSRIVDGGESFWEVVRKPYLKREIPREVVRALVGRAFRDAGGSYKEMARAFRIEDEHKKLFNFLWTQRLRPEDE